MSRGDMAKNMTPKKNPVSTRDLPGKAKGGGTSGGSMKGGSMSLPKAPGAHNNARKH